MIDWLLVFYHTIWMLGLALLLTAFSWTHWQTERAGKSLGQGLNEPAYRLASSAALLLLALGLALSVESPWLKIGWVTLLALALGAGIAAWRNRSHKIH